MHSSIKCSLLAILKDGYHGKIKDFIRTAGNLAQHTTFFLKYWLAHYDTTCYNADFPSITNKHVWMAFQLLNKGPVMLRSEESWRIQEELWPFVDGYCAIFAFQHPHLRYDQQIAHYIGDSILTNIKVNVQEHFVQMYHRYINMRLALKQNAGIIKALPDGDEQIRVFYERVRRFKEYATFQVIPTQDECDSLPAPEWDLLQELWSLFPPQDNCLQYQIVAEPLAYIGPYCGLSRLFEQHGMPLFSAIPLRRSRVQSSIRIDTLILGTHILGLVQSKIGKFTVERKEELWSQVLRLDKKVFKHRKHLGLEFDYSITTNGYSASIHLKHPTLRYGYKRPSRSKAALQQEVKGLYVENHMKELRDAPNIVVIDPNKRDLLFCRDIKEGLPFRYTSNQRAFETKSRMFRRELEALKREAGVQDVETAIPSHKSMDVASFAAFVADFQANTTTLQPFYDRPVHLENRFKAYSLKQRSESKLIRNMRKQYGKRFTVVLGDWNDAGRTMRFQASSKTVGFRKLFTRNRISCFLLDEFRTSSRCMYCEGELIKNFATRPHSRPWRRAQGTTEKVHGLLGCPNPDCTKQDWPLRRVPKRGSDNAHRLLKMKLFNRDVLSTHNMVKIVQFMLEHDGCRPPIFSRMRT
ncbi:hypothetical protein HDU85_005947 [Gaertneriomyces sp. JEL0708]|nr:hypothetical protein HDU85_005947 [Gaertneriomyces sp. JEL0708]